MSSPAEAVAPARPPLLRVEGVSRSFGDKVVLRSASVWATPGRVTVLFGRNGCGKSTLLRIGVGVLRGEGGVTRFDGVAWARPRLAELGRRGLFYWPDEGLLSRRLPLRRQLALCAELRGGRQPGDEVARRIEGLQDLPAAALSGGETRWAELALVEAAAPRCLLADEPLLTFAPKDRVVAASRLRALADAGAALLVTGHEAEDLLDLADEVVWLTGGSTHHLGTPDDARLHHGFRREYLGPGRGRKRPPPPTPGAR